MMIWLPSKVSGMLFCVVFLCFSESVFADGRPNIVLIVADDLGYSDVGFNGCKEIPTPHLDKLAKSGIVFQCGYASHPYCSPSRAGLMTGRYQQRFGHECNPIAEGQGDVEELAAGLPTSETTIAEVLKKSGYVTGAVGKWHLGDAKKFLPLQRGYDEWFGFSGGNLSYWGDLGKKSPSLGIHRNNEPVDVRSLSYLTDDFSSEAVNFIDRNRRKPFFLYLGYNAPHSPDHATKHHLEKTAHIEYGDRAVYGAMVAGMDEGIGRVLAKLEESGLLENTLVVFYSDNGGRKEHAVNFPYRGHKGMLFEGGIRVPFIVSWPKELSKGQSCQVPITALDIFPTILGAAGISTEGLELDGVNLVGVINSKEPPLEQRTLFWRYAMGQGKFGYAVRDGDWKLVISGYKNRDFLFDLAADPWEHTDLAMKHPNQVARLKKLIDEWESGMVAPGWLDPHGPNVALEEATRQKAVDAASAGEKRD